MYIDWSSNIFIPMNQLQWIELVVNTCNTCPFTYLKRIANAMETAPKNAAAKKNTRYKLSPYEEFRSIEDSIYPFRNDTFRLDLQIAVHNIFVTIALLASLRFWKNGSMRSFQVMAVNAEIEDDMVLKIVLTFCFNWKIATVVFLKFTPLRKKCHKMIFIFAHHYHYSLFYLREPANNTERNSPGNPG